MDLPFGVVKIRRGGSAGGHKGMASIITALAASRLPAIRDVTPSQGVRRQAMSAAEVARLKIGIGPRPARMDAKDFVLARFSSAEEASLGATLERAHSALTAVFEKGHETAMNLFNT
jgi:PTH1 family peptidyl-tRNA hydrolase